MASIRKSAYGTYHITIPFCGTRYKRSLRTKDLKTALAVKARVEDMIKMVTRGHVEIPESADVPTFLMSDGKVSKVEAPKEAKLNELADSFFEALPEGSLEVNTIKMMRIHTRHLYRHLGLQFSLRKLSFSDLQTYVSKRSLEDGARGRNIQPTTIRKELNTLRAIWKWSASSEFIPNAPFPSTGLRFPKSNDLPPFQTFDAVAKQTADLDPKSWKARDLWATVFLNRNEIAELLDHVKKNARHEFIYPMFIFAAHTGARRSEILRSQVNDFNSDSITIRERKRKKGRTSTRQVPMSTERSNAMTAWFDNKPPSPFTICHAFRSSCSSQPGDALSSTEAGKHFKTTLSKSRFKTLPGWHALRHSFCSNAAAAGVSDQIIDSWVGHTTLEMRMRYRHLFPNSSKAAMQSMFG